MLQEANVYTYGMEMECEQVVSIVLTPNNYGIGKCFARRMEDLKPAWA